jgi:hypothetical protein
MRRLWAMLNVSLTASQQFRSRLISVNHRNSRRACFPDDFVQRKTIIGNQRHCQVQHLLK